jgi:3-phenylpropionate/trans-cinnamate dioxygenase ferredoxin reductase subunit
MAHPVFGRLRVEHFNNAERHGRSAARSMLGRSRPYDYNFSFWSDQYEHKIEYIGMAHKWDQFVLRGSLDETRFLGFYLQEGRLLAVVGLNRGGDPEAEPDSELSACSVVIRSRVHVPSEQLADDGTDLWDIARAVREGEKGAS